MSSSPQQQERPRRLLLHVAIIGGLIALACSSHKPRTIEDVALESSGRFAVVLQGVVADPDRSARAGEIFMAYRESQARFAEDVTALKADARVKYSEYDTTEEEFDALTAQFRSRRESFRDEISASLADLLEVLEPGEWTETVNLMLEEEDRWRELKR